MGIYKENLHRLLSSVPHNRDRSEFKKHGVHSYKGGQIWIFPSNPGQNPTLTKPHPDKTPSVIFS